MFRTYSSRVSSLLLLTPTRWELLALGTGTSGFYELFSTVLNIPVHYTIRNGVTLGTRGLIAQEIGERGWAGHTLD